MAARLCILFLWVLVLAANAAGSQEAPSECSARSDAAGNGAAACSAEQQPEAASADSQLEGLLQIKAVLDLDDVLTQWTRQTGRDQGYCRWRGVSCSTDAAPGTQQVQAIRLSSSTSGTAVLGLKGRLPPASSLKMLPGLMALHISGQPGVTGPLPDSWAHLLQLEDVRLHDNSLEGELPDSWAALKSLQVLYLHKNKLSGSLPAAWAGLESLEDLTLNENKLTGTLPSDYASLSKLHSLWAFSNKLTGQLPAAYGAMVELKDLQVSYNRFTGELPAEWAALANLRILNVGGNKLQGTLPASYSSLANLQELQLFENNFSGPLPKEWSSLAELQELNVYDNALSGSLPASYKALKNLKSVTISKNMFAGSVPISWGKLKALETFVAWGNEELVGCLPSRWEQQLAAQSWEDEVFEGTVVTGFCQRKADSPAGKAPPSAAM